MRLSEKRAVQEILSQERPLKPFLVYFLIGKNNRKYGVVWRDTEHCVPVMAKDAEHARRVARTAIAHALDTWQTKLKIAVRWVDSFTI